MHKVVLITGATKGIGLATSKLLHEKGYLVVGIARNSIEDFPGQLFCCDLEDPEKTKTLLAQINDQFEVYGVVNNVGIAIPQPLDEVDLNSLYKVYDLNVRVALQTAQSFSPSMKNKKSGRIVNIASRSIFGTKNRSSYSAAKSALIGLTRTWALELAPYAITVNAVAPGPTETELFRQARPIGSLAEKETLATIPLGRIGKPLEIAAAIEFLLSENASFITGQTLCVDGGGSL